MNPQDDPRYHRLPAWVREGIDSLVRERDEARSAHREALLDTNPEATNTRLISSLSRPEVGLPNYAGVRHYLPNQWSNDRTYVDTRVERVFAGNTRNPNSERERLVIQGSGALSIVLQSSNYFYVDVVDR